MDLAGLLNRTVLAIEKINRGRKGFATDGEEHQGRLDYEPGISLAAAAFAEARKTADPKTIMLAEEAFLEQELEYCGEADTFTRSSLKTALQSFDDALLSLEAVEDAAGYKTADKTWPHTPKYRTRDYPRDAFHLACMSHKTLLIRENPGESVDPFDNAE